MGSSVWDLDGIYLVPFTDFKSVVPLNLILVEDFK